MKEETKEFFFTVLKENITKEGFLLGFLFAGFLGTCALVYIILVKPSYLDRFSDKEAMTKLAVCETKYESLLDHYKETKEINQEIKKTIEELKQIVEEKERYILGLYERLERLRMEDH